MHVCADIIVKSSWTGGCIRAHGGAVRRLVFLACMCLPDFPFPPCLTVCGPVIIPWWSAMVTSFLIHLVTVWQSVWLAVFSSMFSSLRFCLFVAIYGRDTYTYISITSISCLCHWQSGVMLLFALHNLWICALLSPCDCLWHWQAQANSVCECDWLLLCSPFFCGRGN